MSLLGDWKKAKSDFDKAFKIAAKKADALAKENKKLAKDLKTVSIKREKESIEGQIKANKIEIDKLSYTPRKKTGLEPALKNMDAALEAAQKMIRKEVPISDEKRWNQLASVIESCLKKYIPAQKKFLDQYSGRGGCVDEENFRLAFLEIKKSIDGALNAIRKHRQRMQLAEANE